MISPSPIDLPCDRVSPRLVRLLRAAEVVRRASRPLTTDEIRHATADQGEGSLSGRTIRRDLTLLASLGAIEYHRGHATRGGAKWKWRGGDGILSPSTIQGTKHGDC